MKLTLSKVKLLFNNGLFGYIKIKCYSSPVIFSYIGEDLGGNCHLATFSEVSSVTLHHVGNDSWRPTGLNGALMDGSVFSCSPSGGSWPQQLLDASLTLSCISLGELLTTKVQI